jgi:hypothetical protein
MSNLYRGPSKDASYQVLKQEWIVAALFVNVTLMGKIKFPDWLISKTSSPLKPVSQMN